MDASAWVGLWVGVAAILVTVVGGFAGIIWRMGGLVKTVEYLGQQFETISHAFEREHGRLWDKIESHQNETADIRSELAGLKAHVKHGAPTRNE